MIQSNQHRPVPRDEMRIDIRIGPWPSEDLSWMHCLHSRGSTRSYRPSCCLLLCDDTSKFSSAVYSPVRRLVPLPAQTFYKSTDSRLMVLGFVHFLRLRSQSLEASTLQRWRKQSPDGCTAEWADLSSQNPRSTAVVVVMMLLRWWWSSRR